MNSLTDPSKQLPAHRRHDIDDPAWAFLEPRLPGRKRTWRDIAHDNRAFINAVLWIPRTGAPWRDPSLDHGDWKNTHRCFYRWRDKGLWESLLEELIDASHCKEHPHAAGARGGNQAMSRTNLWLARFLQGRFVLNERVCANLSGVEWGVGFPRHDESRAWQSSKGPQRIDRYFLVRFFARPLCRLVHPVIYRRKIRWVTEVVKRSVRQQRLPGEIDSVFLWQG